jgi:hypothetical protein
MDIVSYRIERERERESDSPSDHDGISPVSVSSHNIFCTKKEGYIIELYVYYVNNSQ